MKLPQGFTLIEILIALAVFSILATITSSAMYYAFNTRTRVNEQSDRLNSLQLALLQIERDTKQIVKRKVRGNDMHLFPAFSGDTHYLEWTRGGVANPNSIEKRSTLQRIALLCRNNKLIRRHWEQLDTSNRTNYLDKVLLDNLSNCQFGYLNQHLQMWSEWHSNEGPEQQKEKFPKAIQINLVLKDWGKMSLLFTLSEALYAEN